MKKEVVEKISAHLSHGRTFGQRSADKLTEIAGSWGFIFSLFVLLGIWVALNLLA